MFASLAGKQKILWKSKERFSADPKISCDKYRNILRIYTNENCFGFGIEYQYQYHYRGQEEWCDCHSERWGVEINSHFLFGQEHMYYDGPHCFFSLGFLHIQWVNWKCRKCFEGL